MFYEQLEYLLIHILRIVIGHLIGLFDYILQIIFKFVFWWRFKIIALYKASRQLEQLQYLLAHIFRIMVDRNLARLFDYPADSNI